MKPTPTETDIVRWLAEDNRRSVRIVNKTLSAFVVDEDGRDTPRFYSASNDSLLMVANFAGKDEESSDKFNSIYRFSRSFGDRAVPPQPE